jgi:uncharacterized protein (DUF1778 family)
MATDAKTSRRNLRVSPTDDVLFREAASVLGESVSEFLVESGRERAEMVLADRTQFVLGQEAWKAFGAAATRSRSGAATTSPTSRVVWRRWTCG